MIKMLLNIILFTTIIACGEVNKRDLLANDIRLYKGSPVWELAQLVEKEDTSAMRKLLIKDKSKIDYQESNFGKSLLNWATYNSKVNAARILLEYGADPNLPDTYDGRSAFIQSCGYSFFSGNGYDTSTELMELMLKYGADVNGVEVGPRVDGHEVRYSPLLMASSCCYEKVKILVEAGADINYLDEYNRSPLRDASLGNKGADKIMKYLLLEKGADPNKAYQITISGDTLNLSFLIENHFNFEEGTEEFKNKQIILEYLKTKESVTTTFKQDSVK